MCVHSIHTHSTSIRFADVKLIVLLYRALIYTRIERQISSSNQAYWHTHTLILRLCSTKIHTAGLSFVPQARNQPVTHCCSHIERCQYIQEIRLTYADNHMKYASVLLYLIKFVCRYQYNVARNTMYSFNNSLYKNEFYWFSHLVPKGSSKPLELQFSLSLSVKQTR